MDIAFSELLKSANTLFPASPMTENLAGCKILESYKSPPQSSVETSLDLLWFDVGEEERSGAALNF